ncbi:MAG: rod-binding protein [Deferribacteraceae bacterium]|jgi:flagellar protein FlgJ|nr:rod-binding protein [Deferribacteraceae bacterium]
MINDIKSVSSISTEHAKAVKTSVGEDDRLKSVCQDFEALFIEQILKAMRASEIDSGLVKKSRAEKIFREMLDSEYSVSIARSSNGGLGELLYKQIKEVFLADDAKQKKTA